MASNPHRQRSMSIATVHLDPDDLSELPRADYMYVKLKFYVLVS